MFELRWTAGAIAVTMGLKIVSSPESAGAAPQEQGFRGMKLPETIVGKPSTAAAPRPSGWRKA